jgi:CRISPR-associated protein Csm4
MSLVAYRLRPAAPMHLGAGRADDLADLEELPRSDTILAGVVSASCLLGASAQEAEDLAAHPPFALSSALPTVEVGGRHVCLLPVPTGLFDRLRSHDRGDKRLRRARYVPPAILEELLAGRIPDDVVAVGGVLIDRSSATRFPKGLWRTASRTRLAVNRLDDGPIEGLLYEFGEVVFSPGVTLTILVSFQQPEKRSAFEAALRLLADEGLGADRTAGYGRLGLEAAEPFNVAPGTGMRLNLSLLHPTKAEVEKGLLDEPAVYDLVIRGGWVTAPGGRTLRRRAVRMLSEGAVVRDLGTDAYGDSPRVLEPMPELGLSHSVYRPGVAVTVPIPWPPRA